MKANNFIKCMLCINTFLSIVYLILIILFFEGDGITAKQFLAQGFIACTYLGVSVFNIRTYDDEDEELY